MKNFRCHLIFCVFVLINCTTLYGTEPYCQNLGFEQGDFTNWVGYTWTNSTVPDVTSTNPVQNMSLQTIMTDTNAYDAKTNYKVKKVPTGYRYAARLGDELAKTQVASLRYTLAVDSMNAFLTYKFAVVLLNPMSGHDKHEEPRFKVTIFDEQGDSIDDCSNYDVYASDAELSNSFVSYKPAGSDEPVLYRDWTTVGANLLPYLGKTVTIEFMAADCTHKGHYGYAYFVAECHPLYITVKYCTGDNSARLTAPDGFQTYKWLNEKREVISNSRAYDDTNPMEGAVYTCDMTSATGCSISLTSTIAKYEPNADFEYNTVDCNNLTNTVKFSNLYPATHGNLEYKWDFGDGNTSTEKSPVHTFTTSGLHPVSLVVSNPPSLCTDSVTKYVETFYPPLVGISGDSTYCSGSLTVLKGMGAYRYEWSTGSTVDSILVDKDTDIWLIGYSSKGCYTDTIRTKVKEKPDWKLTTGGNSLFCTGDSTTLSASGAERYLWSTGDTTNTISIGKEGIYTLSAFNRQGCEKTVSFNVTEDPLPGVEFKLSGTTVDTRHNELLCSVDPQPEVLYSWDMGDSSVENGATITHKYTVDNTLNEYKIKLTATNANGCVNSTTQTVDIVPFIPNVFTPNGDGVNERFVTNMDLQIIDRYGTLIYKGTDGWDGRYQGKLMDNDAYFYLIHYTDKYGKTHTLKGTVTLKQ